MMGTMSQESGMEDDFNPYVDMPITKLVALYDYSYQDDDGNVVNMTQGEEYHLLQKEGDWWEVIRDAGDPNELSFYVPANYVKIVGKNTKGPEPPPKRVSFGLYSGNDNLDSESTTTDASSANVTPEKDNENKRGSESLNENMRREMEPLPDYHNDVEERSGLTFERKNSTSTFTSFGNKTLPPNAGLTGAKPPNVRRSFSDEGDYVNLDRYRSDAGIKSERTDSSCEQGLYANLKEIHNEKPQGTPRSYDPEPSSPDPPGQYMRTLLDVWDMYLDPNTNRMYYINKETKERTFKPPRPANKFKQHQNLDQKPVDQITRKKSAPELKLPRDQGVEVVPEGYVIEEEEGRKVFVNPNTNERWLSSENADGEMYFYKDGTDETVWELPKIITSPDTPPPTIARNRSPSGSPLVGRSVKARSMIISSKLQLDASNPTAAAIPKSSTLPILSTPALMEEVEPEKKSTPMALHPPDTLDGMLQKAKVMEGGKGKKKSWSQCYVKLAGTNLVFYKNQLAAKSQPGSPYGKPEFIVPLKGAHVDRDNDKSSKKNVISLKTSQGDEYLLQNDEEVTILKWLAHLEVAINGLGGNKVQGLEVPVFSEESSSTKERRKGSFKVFPGRNNSGSEPEMTNERRKRGIIKDKLLNFVSRRPTKESLEQKGIIKDAVFGADLRVLCEKEKGKIPKFVQKCVTAIEKRGLDHDGLYRISGNLAQIQKLRCQVDQDAENQKYHDIEEDSYNLDEDRWDVHVLTGALKLFFRELKEPLFTFQMFDKFVPALSKEKNVDRQKAVKELIVQLPKCNYESMKFLFAHLLKVIDLSKENRMQVHNVAIVFGPTLIWPEKESPNMAANMVYQSRIVEYCLLEYKYIFR